MRIERHFAAVAASGLALALTACGGSGGAGGFNGTIAADEPSLGKAGAPVVMVEYASTSCGHCAAFNNNTFHAFKEKHIDTGDVHYALREIASDPIAGATFVLARCVARDVAKDKYYPVVDAVFRSQAEIITSSNPAGNIKQIALSAGLTEDQYNKCLTDDEAFKALEARVKKNSTEGKVESTPTFYINGVKQDFDAAVTLDQLSKAVADAKAKAK